MALVISLMGVVFPVFAVAAVGFGWIRLGLDYPNEFIARLATMLAIPCLIFSALIGAEVAPSDLGAIGLASVLAYLLIAVIWVTILRLGALPIRSYLAPLTLGNTGNIGLPISFLAFGQAGLEMAVVVFAVTSFLMFSAGLVVVSGELRLRRLTREPMVWSALLGALGLGLGWQPPEPVLNAVELLGQLAIPLMLLTLGASVARLGVGKLGLALTLALSKWLVGMICALAIGYGLGLTDLALAVLVLQMVTPVGVTSFVLAERFNADPGKVSGLVVVTTALSVVLLPITLSFLGVR